MMEFWLIRIKDWIWGPPLLLLILGTGAYLTFLLKGIQFRYLGFALKQIFSKAHRGAKGDISHFEALMTSLAGAIGTGAIVGVSTGILIGGLGSLFWMWITALFGMATKYAESLLAVKYRHVDSRGEMIGGPMQYIEKGIKWKWLAILYAFFGAIAAIGTGNLVQANAISESIHTVFSMNPLITGTLIAVLTAFVIIGGVRIIGHVAGVMVPLMALFYFTGGLSILVIYYDRIPSAIYQIFQQAFTGPSIVGGAIGGSVLITIQLGVARSIFSNEAGLGISSIAAAAAKTDTPGRQAMINMTGALLSTIIVCTITGLVLAVTQVIDNQQSGVDYNGATIAIYAFNTAFQGGGYIVVIGLILFAFSTIIAWGYYGEKCCEYLLGERYVFPYRILYCFLALFGALLKVETVWIFADISNALMAIPNLIALLFLSGVIVAETKKFLEIIKKERI